jgi:hypothetical protein
MMQIYRLEIFLGILSQGAERIFVSSSKWHDHF